MFCKAFGYVLAVDEVLAFLLAWASLVQWIHSLHGRNRKNPVLCGFFPYTTSNLMRNAERRWVGKHSQVSWGMRWLILKAPARQETETGVRMRNKEVVRSSCCMWRWWQSKNMSQNAKRMRKDYKGTKGKEKERLGTLRNMPEKAKHLQDLAKTKLAQPRVLNNGSGTF